MDVAWWVNGVTNLMIFLSPITFVSLLIIDPAPYGRYYKDERGLSLNPKFAWMTQECPSFFIPLVILVRAGQANLTGMTHQQIALLAMFLIHYGWRSFFFPLLLRGGKPTPFHVWIFAVFFCICNGFIQGESIIYFSPAAHTPMGLRFLLGAGLWAAGWAGNLHADHILRCLRAPGETGYKIPRGGLFEYVSGANYFAETVEWVGFAIASWSKPGFAFALFTFANTAPRALRHHRWYIRQFGAGYPPGRKAILPFIL